MEREFSGRSPLPSGPLLIPLKLWRVLAPATRVKGLPAISTPPISTCTLAVELLTFHRAKGLEWPKVRDQLVAQNRLHIETY